MMVTLQSKPRAVIYKHEAEEYVGGKELFLILCERYKLRPVHRFNTRILYLVASIDRALAEKEAAENLEND